MKALTVRQPWAELILLGRKRYELRSWPTRHRGQLLVHAGSSASPMDQENCHRAGLDWRPLDRGAIVGVVEVVDCVPYTPDIYEELSANQAEFDPWAEDQWAFVLTNPRRLVQLIARPGKLGL
jgi:hypothetical protein